jgi:hypothetical protein
MSLLITKIRKAAIADMAIFAMLSADTVSKPVVVLLGYQHNSVP